LKNRLESIGLTLKSVVKLDCLFRDVWNIPPMTMASINCIGGAPETDTAKIIDKFVKNCNLAEIKPDYRHFCFDHPQGKLSDGNDHGFERWVSIPDDISINDPMNCINLSIEPVDEEAMQLDLLMPIKEKKNV